MHETWRATVRLAELLEVPVVLAFSGCPGDSPTARFPNWVTFPWPDDYAEVLEWQWNERVLPYWTREAAFAREHGVRIAIEMSPGFVVYNLETLLRLRSAAGSEIGVNFDPSHLHWQQVDPVTFLEGHVDRIVHVHMKDAARRLDGHNGILASHLPFGDGRRGWDFYLTKPFNPRELLALAKRIFENGDRAAPTGSPR